MHVKYFVAIEEHGNFPNPWIIIIGKQKKKIPIKRSNKSRLKWKTFIFTIFIPIWFA